jgi:hypothetical protein
MADSIFFSHIDSNVEKALNARKAVYGAMDRTSINGISAEAAENWLYKKTAWVTAIAKSKSSGTVTLNNSNKGGIVADSLYKSLSTATSNSTSGLVPKPHITSVSISNQGRLGSTKQAEIKFTVYDINTLNDYQSFFDIGSEVGVRYGWSVGNSGTVLPTDCAGPVGNFIGKVYNFSYQLTTNGAFECTSQVIGPGTSALGNRMNGVISLNLQKELKDYSDINGTRTTGDFVTFSNTLLDYFSYLEYQYLNGYGLLYKIQSSDTAIGGIIVKAVSKTLTEGNPAEKYKDQYGNDVTKVKPGTRTDFDSLTYISLERICSILPAIWNGEFWRPYIDNITGFGDDFLEYRDNSRLKRRPKLVCNPKVTRWNPPSSDIMEIFRSANPLEIIFPGTAAYPSWNSTNINNITTDFGRGNILQDPYVIENPTALDPRNPDYDLAFKSGDASKIMININWLRTLIDKNVSKGADKGENSSEVIASKILSDIFESIYQNSGGKIKLSLVEDSKISTNLLVTDVGIISHQQNKSPFQLTAMTKDSICRNVSLVSKVPSRLAAAAYTTGISNGSVTEANAINATGELNNTPSYIGNLKDGAREALDNLGLEKVDANSISKAQDALFGLINNSPKVNSTLPTDAATVYKDSMIIPLEFSATLDGIDGIVFGNAFTFNYLPAKYQSRISNTTICFTATNVTHQIANNDWSTTITTVMRVIPSNITVASKPNPVNTTQSNTTSNIEVTDNASPIISTTSKSGDYIPTTLLDIDLEFMKNIGSDY